jgi:nicotinamidase-related amidase
VKTTLQTLSTIPKLAVVVMRMQPNNLRCLDVDVRGKMETAQIEVIRLCQQHHIPIIVVEDSTFGDSTTDILTSEMDGIKQKHVVRIENCNAFSSRTFTKPLEQLHIRNLLLMGMEVSTAILSTAMEAKPKGIRIHTSPYLIAEASITGEPDEETMGSLRKHAVLLNSQLAPWKEKKMRTGKIKKSQRKKKIKHSPHN